MQPLDPTPYAVYAHRGARAHAPENTLLAFALAYDLGADAIECDAQLTADGALVIIHDDTLDRTTTGRGPVAALTLAELRALDAGLGQRIPTLNETLSLSTARARGINLEVKAATPEGALATAAALEPTLLALDTASRERLLVSSFALPAIAHLKRRLPWLLTAALYDAAAWHDRDLVAPARDIGAEAIHPGVSLVTPELVARAHQLGMRVNVWTANRWATLRQLFAWGVDGVFSDLPERAVITRTLGGAAYGTGDQTPEHDRAVDAT